MTAHTEKAPAATGALAGPTRVVIDSAGIELSASVALTPQQLRKVAWTLLLQAAERERLESSTPWPAIEQGDGFVQIHVPCEWWPGLYVTKYGDDSHPHPWVIEDAVDGSTWDESDEARQTAVELANVVNLCAQLNARDQATRS